MSSSADASPSVTPSSTPLSGTHAPKYGTVIPNRIFVGGIAANTSELELKQFFTTYGAVKDSKIIADRAGVSKGYGFITFENQEDADRIIKKESDNLVFKDRKLNIGPAVRKQVTSQDQVMPRTFGVDSLSSDTLDASIPAGTVLLANGVPYTYQNGMAIFHAPEGGYPIAQPQISTPSYSAMMVPQTPTMYIAPQYSAYQPSTPQWTSPSGQWRWAQQSPQQAVTGSPYIYATTMHASPELMYAQPPPHAYQPTELTDSTIMPDTQQTVEPSTPGMPREGTNVVLSGVRVLLDVSVSVNSITIEAGAELVVDNKDVNIKTRYILVKGAFIIGSETCQISTQIKISLFGNKDDVSIPDFGEKFIGVASGGVLEIHGMQKLAWTKLTKTVNNIKDGTISDQWNEKQLPTEDEDRGFQGIIMYVWDPTSGKLEYARGVYSAGRTVITKRGNQCEADKEAEILQKILDDIAPGKIVGFALRRNLIKARNVNLAMFYEIMENFGYGKVTGSLGMRNFKLHDAWAMITKKGDFSSTQEGLVKDMKKDLERTAQFSHVENDIRFIARSWVHTIRRNQCYSRAMSVISDFVNPVLHLVDDASSWIPGDKVVLFSTDFDMNQAEDAEVIPCTDCAANQVRINLEPKFTHYGEIYKRVDMRGEVALLTRNVVVEGLDASNSQTLGGHIKIIKGFSRAFVENLRLYKMGQLDSIGNYPYHFHMCEDTLSADGVAPYFRNNVIQNSFARCVTVHGTNDVVIENNVCFGSFGHGFFMEEGGEKRVTFRGNLGQGQRRTSKLTKTDRNIPSTFWITNPTAVVENNVAAGSEAAGFWYIFPDSPIGLSKDKGFMAVDEAKHTSLTSCVNNVAHSNGYVGFTFEGRLKKDTGIQWGTQYDPLSIPTDSKSAVSSSQITRLTVYKNRIKNAVIDGSRINVVQSSFSDSLLSMVFKESLFNKLNTESAVRDSVFIGESPNIGDPAVVKTKNGKTTSYPRSVPWKLENEPRQGYVFNDRPNAIKNSWFGNFASTDQYTVGALGFQRNLRHFPAHAAHAHGLQFGFDDPLGGNRVFEGNGSDIGFTSHDGDQIVSFVDHGSVTEQSQPVRVVKPLPIHLTPECTLVDTWNMAYCAQDYAQVRASYEGGGKTSKLIVNRDDLINDPVSPDKQHSAPFMTILGGGYSYLARANTNTTPSWFRFQFRGVTLSQFVRIGACVPRDANVDIVVFDTVTKKWQKGTEVKTLTDLDASTSVKSYFVDKEVGVIFFKGMHSKERTASDMNECLDSTCPMVVVRSKGGTRSDNNCFQRMYPKYERTELSSIASRKKRQANQIFPKTSKDPPTTMGAGDTRPRKGQ